MTDEKVRKSLSCATCEICFSYFSHWRDKCSLRRGEFVLAPSSKGYSPSWWLECVAAGHCGPQQADRSECLWAALFLFTKPEPSLWDGATHF